MVVDKTVELLEALLSGRLDISEFEQQLSDDLFELRQDPAVGDQRRALSRIQLYLHELHEGNRDLFEVYMAVQAALDLLHVPSGAPDSKPQMYAPPRYDVIDLPIPAILFDATDSKPETYPRSPKPGAIVPGTASRPQDIVYIGLR